MSAKVQFEAQASQSNPLNIQQGVCIDDEMLADMVIYNRVVELTSPVSYDDPPMELQGITPQGNAELDAVLKDKFVSDSERKCLVATGFSTDFVNALAGVDGSRFSNVLGFMGGVDSGSDSTHPFDPSQDGAIAMLSSAGFYENVLFNKIPALIDIFYTGGLIETFFAQESLAKIGKAALPALIEELHSENQDVRNNAISTLDEMACLGTADATDAVPALISKLHERTHWMRQNAILALSNIAPGDERVICALIGASVDEHFNVRSYAIGHLGDMKTPLALHVFIHALEDEHEFVRETAFEALVDLGDDALPVLNETYETALKDHNLLLVNSIPLVIHAIEERGQGGR